uniref:Uncharacterized protein n=1 Tax=Paramoeba aestuarina TaxID=180227 RepID=A0A7S4NNI1_9EUKA
MYECSLLFSPKKIDRIPEYQKKWEAWHNSLQNPFHHATLEESAIPHFLPHTVYNPILIDSTQDDSHKIQHETTSTLEMIENMDPYKEDGATVYQISCGWPCGKNSFFSSSLGDTGKVVRERNLKKYSDKEWELGVLVLIRDPVESVISHAREYRVDTKLQVNLTRLALSDVTVQLNSLERMLGKKYTQFAFSSELLKNLYSYLSPQTYGGVKGVRRTQEAKKCMTAMSKFLREHENIVQCAVMKTGEMLSRRHYSYGKNKHVGPETQALFDSVFGGSEHLWPIFHECNIASSLCPIPPPCLPFL